MVNFFKEGGVGKIQFASGEIVSLSGSVSILADNTVNQLIISENGRDKFWISTAGILQVNGSNITGTNQQKKDLIMPVFTSAGSSSSEQSGFTWDMIVSDAGTLGVSYTNPALISPNGTAWELKKTADNAIMADDNTTLTGVASIVRNGWTITINNQGVLSQSKP